MWHVLPADRKPHTTSLLMTMLPCETMFECQVTRPSPPRRALGIAQALTGPSHPPRCSQERKYVEQHKGALHKPLPTALMNKAFKHFQQDQSENSVG
jgi:hypothetical protein